MKNRYLTLQLLFIFLASVSNTSYSQNITDTVYREAETYQLLDQIESDPILQLEWLTALHFHKIINDYRNEKGKKSIYWDHKLWMAARNHNVYLLRDSKYLTHTESSKKTYFSGKHPENRVEFVNYSSKEFEYAGYENCYFSGVDFSLDRLNISSSSSTSKKEMVEIAKGTAEEGFEIWKNSMGHNQNMLNQDHMSQGTAFVFGYDGVYGTSLFASKQEYYQPDTIFLPFLKSFVDTSDFRITSDYYPHAPPRHELKRLTYKHFYTITLFFKEKMLFSNKALYTISKMKNPPENQKELKKAYRKERGLKGFFELFSHNLSYHHFTIDMNYTDYKRLKGMEKIRQELQLFFNDTPTEIKYWGGDVVTQKAGDNMEVEVSVLFLVKKK